MTRSHFPMVLLALALGALAGCRITSEVAPECLSMEVVGFMEDDVAAVPDGVLDPEADPTEAMYAPDRLLNIQIDMDPDDWDALRLQKRTWEQIIAELCAGGPFSDVFTYFPATVTVDGEVMTNVGVRKKGFLGSLNDYKPALKVKFTEYDDEARLHGLRRMTLNNSQQDPSFAATCLAYKLFRDAGYPAPRCNHAKVTVNGKYMGVFVHVESVKKPYPARHFADDEGNLYEGTVSDFTYDFEATFEKKTNRQENDWSDLDALVAAVALEGPEWLEAVAGLVELERFFTFWALEVLIGHWDGYAGNRNNYYVYADPADGRFVFLPWGADAVFRDLQDASVEDQPPVSVLANGVLAHRLYEDPETRQTYRETMEGLLDGVWDAEALVAELDRVRALLTPHVFPVEEYNFDLLHQAMREFITGRKDALLADLETSPDWPLPLPELYCPEPHGAVQVSFETLWQVAPEGEPWTHGEVVFDQYEVDGEEVPLSQSGCSASQDENDPSLAVISVFSTQPAATLDLLLLFVPRDLVEAGFVGDFKEYGIHGLRLVLSPPDYDEWAFLASLDEGTLTLDAAVTELGGPIKGSFEATISF